MSKEFERQKNTRALIITGAISGGLLLVIMLISWTIPPKIVPPVDDYVEIEMEDVNLGSSVNGSGNDQPQLPGQPAPQQASYTAPQSNQANEEAVKDVSSENEKDNEAPAVTKPVVSKPEATKTNAESKVVKNTNPNPQPVVQAPKPKAVLTGVRGGNGSGGNGADTYKPGTNEGNGTGPGDKGVVGGDPNGKNYPGPVNFGRRNLPIAPQDFTDDFNSNATIAMVLELDQNAKVISASYTAKGSTGTATAKMRDIARDKAFKLRFDPSQRGQKGVVLLRFQVQ